MCGENVSVDVLKRNTLLHTWKKSDKTFQTSSYNLVWRALQMLWRKTISQHVSDFCCHEEQTQDYDYPPIVHQK